MMRPLLAWVTTICDPLTGLPRRARTEREMAGALVSDPIRSSIVMAGLVHPLVQALPPDDPWRHVVVRGDRAETGGRPFGGVGDLLDLIPRGAQDVGDDLALAGLDEQMPLAACRLLGIASQDGVGDLASAVLGVIQADGDAGEGIPADWVTMVPGAGSAAAYAVGFLVRRVLARYRCYVGDGGISGEVPQLAYELDLWTAALPVEDGVPATPSSVRSVLKAGGEPPRPISGPIPVDAYARFRLV